MPKSSAVLAWWEAPDLVVGAAGPYIVVNNTRRGEQLIASFDASDRDPLGDAQGLVHTRSITASAVWGDKLWKPGTRRGTVNSYDLRTKANSAEIALGSGCRPDELQAGGAGWTGAVRPSGRRACGTTPHAGASRCRCCDAPSSGTVSSSTGPPTRPNCV
ncbi:hypothetical protein [Streptomyces sp. NPDC000229]|uniref:hypothetical protein n=1 Tax=Streptomyces sp. NPDC000229 TaxID=3154247 RepID=UPI003327C0C2